MSPWAPLKPCNKPGCPILVNRGVRFCDEHQKEYDNSYERDPKIQKLYGARWRKIRSRHLKRFPLCYDCEQKGITKAGEEVHHIEPHKGNSRLFYDLDNLMTLCKSCHSRRTANEGRWGK